MPEFHTVNSFTATKARFACTCRMFKQTAGVSLNLVRTKGNSSKFYPLQRETSNDAAYRILLTESVDISVDDRVAPV